MKGIKIIFATIMMVLLCATIADAQTRKKSSSSTKKKTTATAASKKRAAEAKDEAREESFWKTKMWYGADINYPSITARSFFNMALSPRIAYKFTPWLSSGIVVRMDYYWLKLETNSFVKPITTFETLDLGGGIFARAKIFRGLYIQSEYTKNRYIRPNLTQPNTFIYDFDDSKNKLNKSKYGQDIFTLGAGWSSGFGKWQTQIGAYRDLLWKEYESPQQTPWDVRLGFTYNF
jgi:hypothetical protein